MGAPTDGELRAELATAASDRAAAIHAELDRRKRHRATLRGHDPNLCDHPVRCTAVR